jgi:hypothetical protein
MTTLEQQYCASVFNDNKHAFIDANNSFIEYHTNYPTYTFLDSFCHDYNNRIPSAVTYMQRLEEYTKECLHEQEEWKVDEQAEIHRNYNIMYPKCDDLTIP